MCTYALQYHAEGVLTTDWGDYGHLNHPDFSIPGMIYGAAFSWNRNIPSFDEINRQISQVEYGDRSGRIVSILARIPLCQTFEWREAIHYIETSAAPSTKELAGTVQALHDLENISLSLRRMMPELPDRTNTMLHACLVAIRGQELFQRIGVWISVKENRTTQLLPMDGMHLATELEEWFMFYKEVWRSVSRESELYRIQNVVFRYADLLRS